MLCLILATKNDVPDDYSNSTLVGEYSFVPRGVMMFKTFTYSRSTVRPLELGNPDQRALHFGGFNLPYLLR